MQEKEHLFTVRFVFDYLVVVVPIPINLDDFLFLEDSEEDHLEEELEAIALNEAIKTILYEGLEVPHENARIEIEREDENENY